MNRYKISPISRASVLSILFCVALTSCTVGPDYKQPDLEAPAAYKSIGPKDGSSSLVVASDWWTLFHDPGLSQLEEEGVKANHDLKAAMARVAEARAASQSVKSQFYPTITLDPSVQRSRTPNLTTNPNGTASTTTLTHIPFDLGYEIDVWGRVRRTYEASKAQTRASEADEAVVMLTMEADIAQNYFNLRSFDTQDQILNRNMMLYQKQLDLTQQLFKTGLAGKTDVLQAQTLLDSTRVQEMEISRQRADTEHAIAILVGKPPADLTLAPHPLDVTPPFVPPGLPSDLLRQRPDVAEAEDNLIAANAQVGVAKANFFPVFQLTGVAGFESIDIQHVFDWKSRIFSLGPNVTIPLFEGGQLNANLRQAKARYEEVLENFHTAILGAYRDVEDSLTDLHFQVNEAEAQTRAVDSSRESLTLIQTQYKEGLTSYLQVIDADRTLLTNELSSAQILNQQLVSTVLLIKSIGGGWHAESEDSAKPKP